MLVGELYKGRRVWRFRTLHAQGIYTYPIGKVMRVCRNSGDVNDVQVKWQSGAIGWVPHTVLKPYYEEG